MADKNDKNIALRIRNGFSAEATFEDKLVFTTPCLENYNLQRLYGNPLSKCFADDSHLHSSTDSIAIDLDACCNPHGLLPKVDVYFQRVATFKIPHLCTIFGQKDISLSRKRIHKIDQRLSRVEQ